MELPYARAREGVTDRPSSITRALRVGRDRPTHLSRSESPWAARLRPWRGRWCVGCYTGRVGLGNRTGTRQRGPYSLPRTWTGARDFRRGGCGSRHGKPHVDFVEGRPDEVTRRSVGAAASSAERASANLPSASRIASDIAAAL